MMKKLLISLISVFLLSTSFYEKGTIKIDKKNNNTISKPLFISPSKSENKTKLNNAVELYASLNFENFNKLNPEVFSKAFLGFENLKTAGKIPKNSHLLSICDFSLSSTQKRLWVIDLDQKKILFNSLVAHGKNTGEEFAEKFSNTESSYQSSIGFYVTESTYTGENGYSLKLLGMDSGYNDRALQRAIVMHGADYVSEDFIKSQKRIGRSWGCPAIPRALAEPIINSIKGKNCLFIYYPDEQYLSTSQWLKTEESI